MNKHSVNMNKLQLYAHFWLLVYVEMYVCFRCLHRPTAIMMVANDDDDDVAGDNNDRLISTKLLR